MLDRPFAFCVTFPFLGVTPSLVRLPLVPCTSFLTQGRNPHRRSDPRTVVILRSQIRAPVCPSSEVLSLRSSSSVYPHLQLVAEDLLSTKGRYLQTGSSRSAAKTSHSYLCHSPDSISEYTPPSVNACHVYLARPAVAIFMQTPFEVLH